jgi:hypothetical protein
MLSTTYADLRRRSKDSQPLLYMNLSADWKTVRPPQAYNMDLDHG